MSFFDFGIFESPLVSAAKRLKLELELDTIHQIKEQERLRRLFNDPANDKLFLKFIAEETANQTYLKNLLDDIIAEKPIVFKDFSKLREEYAERATDIKKILDNSLHRDNKDAFDGPLVFDRIWFERKINREIANFTKRNLKLLAAITIPDSITYTDEPKTQPSTAMEIPPTDLDIKIAAPPLINGFGSPVATPNRPSTASNNSSLGSSNASSRGSFSYSGTEISYSNFGAPDLNNEATTSDTSSTDEDDQDEFHTVTIDDVETQTGDIKIHPNETPVADAVGSPDQKHGAIHTPPQHFTFGISGTPRAHSVATPKAVLPIAVPTKKIDENLLVLILANYKKLWGPLHSILGSTESAVCCSRMLRENIIKELMVKYDCKEQHITPDIVAEHRFVIAQEYYNKVSNQNRAFGKALAAVNIKADANFDKTFYEQRKTEIQNQIISLQVIHDHNHTGLADLIKDMQNTPEHAHHVDLDDNDHPDDHDAHDYYLSAETPRFDEHALLSNAKEQIKAAETTRNAIQDNLAAFNSDEKSTPRSIMNRTKLELKQAEAAVRRAHQNLADTNEIIQHRALLDRAISTHVPQPH